MALFGEPYRIVSVTVIHLNLDLLLNTYVLILSFYLVTARQAAKNTPRRLPSVAVRSPLGASPTSMDSQADSSVSTPTLETGGTTSEDTGSLSVVRVSTVFRVSTGAGNRF